MTSSLPMPRSYWVIPGQLAAGGYPGALNELNTLQKIDAFLEAGFTCFFDLTGPNELPPYKDILFTEARIYEMDVCYQSFPIGDFGLPTPPQMHALLNAIEDALTQERQIYLHCWGGSGRTGTAIGCYLVRRGLSGEEALKQVQDWCHYSISPETEAQRQFVLNWTRYELSH